MPSSAYKDYQEMYRTLSECTQLMLSLNVLLSQAHGTASRIPGLGERFIRDLSGTAGCLERAIADSREGYRNLMNKHAPL